MNPSQFNKDKKNGCENTDINLQNWDLGINVEVILN